MAKLTGSNSTEMKAHRVSLGEVALDDSNARKHGERDLSAIAASLKEFGQQTPIVVDSSRVVIKGNGTVLAAKSLGWTHLWAVESDLAGLKAKAYAIADNKTGLLSEWDSEVLNSQLRQISSQDDSLLLSTGFDEMELDKILAGISGEGKGSASGAPGDPLEIRGYGKIWVLLGLPADKGLEASEICEFAMKAVGEKLFVETTIAD